MLINKNNLKMRNTSRFRSSSFLLSFFVILSCLSYNTIAATSFLSQGIQSLKQGDNTQAVQYLNEAVKQQPNSAKAFYYLGLAASKQGNHIKAVAAFKRTIKINSKIQDVHLALGIAYYELELNTLAQHALEQELKLNANNSSALYFSGLIAEKSNEHSKAIAYFEQVSLMDKGLEQLAIYNIAFSYLAESDNDLAKQNFQKVINLDGNTKLADNSKSMLLQLSASEGIENSNLTKKSNKRWKVEAKTGFEFDDNVTVSDIDTTTGIEDAAATFEFSGSYKIIEKEGFELDAEYNLFQSVYKELSEFDLQSHSLSLSATKELGEIDTGLNYSYNLTFLGGDRFFESQSVMPYIGLMPLSNWYATVNYNYIHKNFFAVSDRDAEQHGMGVSNYIFFNDAQSHAVLSYRFESENTVSDRFDYQGHYFTTGLNSKFSDFKFSPKAHVTYEYNFRDYDSITPSIGQKRRDERHTISIGTSLALNSYLNADIELQHIEANSNFEFSDYDENIVTFDLSVSY